MPICHICHSEKTHVYCEKNGYTLYQCDTCHFVFVYPIPKNLSAVYGENYFHDVGGQEFGYSDYDSDKEPMRHIFEQYLNIFDGFSKDKTILDVGCATGYFLDRAKERGWKTYGVEISEYAAKEANLRGHEVHVGEFPKIPRTNTMDIVTMWDVLEHVNDPRAYLVATHDVLCDGGYLAINTVDIGSVWARLMGHRWHLIVPPEHIHYYTKGNLRKLLTETGFDTIEIKKIGKRFSLTYFFMTGYRWQRLTLWKKIAEYFNTPQWEKVSIPFNLRDNIFVLARKRKV